MEKLRLAQLGERLKVGGAQLGRVMSEKMKDLLQSPTPESRIVDDATSENLEEPNWGLNMRICSMINSGEFSGMEIVRGIKKKISCRNAVCQRLSLDLLEACTMNCEKVFSEVASEKLLDEMVRMIENQQTDHGNKKRALELIKAWGESQDLAYLPAFHQTYMSLMRGGMQSVQQDPLVPPGSYPVPDSDLLIADDSDFYYNGSNLSVEGTKEFILATRSAAELLSSLLNSETEPKPLKDDLTVGVLEKCRQSQPVIQRIIETTANDEEGLLFEALNLNDELQRVFSRYAELEAAANSVKQQQPPENSVPASAGGEADSAPHGRHDDV